MPAAKSKINLGAINAIAELDRLGWKYEPAGDHEVSLCCPVHDDNSPSVGLNTQKNVWRCRASNCNARGDIISLLTHIVNKDGKPVERSTILHDLQERYPELVPIKTINPATIEKWHERIFEAGPLLSALRDRGVTDDMIRRARIGYHDGRITIPIYDEAERCVNVRRYLPGAPGREKFRNAPGYGGLRLYQPKQTKYDAVWVCGGEMKALVAASLLNAKGIGAVSVTGGEGAWDHSLTPKFKDKRVYVCMDVDSGGRIAAKTVARALFYAASYVKIIRLPLDREKFPKGDLNDYVAAMDPSAEDFVELMASAENFALEDTEEVEPEVRRVRLAESSDANNMPYRVVTQGVVSALHEVPFLLPRRVGVSCTRDQPNCSWCPVRPKDPDPDTDKVELTIKGTSPAVLEMAQAGKRHQKNAIREGLGIPPCKAAEFSVREHTNAWDVRLSPQLSVGGDNSDHVVLPAMVVGHSVELNTPYQLSGRVFPHPKNQEAVLVLDDVDVAEDNLKSFEPTGEDLVALDVFRPEEWTSKAIGHKMNTLYQDLETNVTHIFERRALHMVVDLAYHSVLNFRFDGRLQNGWVNALIAGDSAQGKSEASIRLMEHYRVGERVECKNASVAGLIGGVQQLGNRWFVSWGVIPTHDKRLLFLEEIKGTPTEVIGKLTDMRSSGVAEISKIEKRRAHARTRLIMISNPRSDRSLSAYNFGVEVIKELIGGLEDIRRFDIAMLLSSRQVDVNEVSRMRGDRGNVPHIHTSELCQKLVLWAWTRTPDQIHFAEGAEQACVEATNELCERYSDAMPLIDRGTTRYKIARLAAALAARTFSTNDDRTDLIVLPAHVEHTRQLIRRLYDDPVFGYHDFSKAQEYADKVLHPDVVEKQVLSTKYPRDLVEHLLHRDEVTVIDLADWCEMERDQASKLLSLLVRKHALYRQKRWYVKTAEFITLLKKLRDRGLPEENILDRKDEF